MKPKKTAKASLKAKATKACMTRARVDGKPGKPNDVSWHGNFLKVLSETANVAQACRTVGIAWSTANEHRAKFRDFALAWKDCEEMGLDEIRAVLMDHAINGTLRPIYQGGMHVGNVRDFDHGLGQWFLERKRPAEFGAKQKLELSGKITMTDEEITQASEQTHSSLLLTMAGGMKGTKEA